MTSAQIVYWRDIPAQVKVRDGRERRSQSLSPRFQVAIDAAAMRDGVTGSEEYLAEWRASEPEEHPGSLDQVAAATVAALEAAYPVERLQRLVERGGRG
jgi:hypothetical protein